MNNKQINFYKIPLSVSFNEVKQGMIVDEQLQKAITSYSEELAEEGKET